MWFTICEIVAWKLSLRSIVHQKNKSWTEINLSLTLELHKDKEPRLLMPILIRHFKCWNMKFSIFTSGWGNWFFFFFLFLLFRYLKLWLRCSTWPPSYWNLDSGWMGKLCTRTHILLLYIYFFPFLFLPQQSEGNMAKIARCELTKWDWKVPRTTMWFMFYF